MTGPAARGATVRQGDRLKAWRPLPAEARRAAFEAALKAWAQGDFFMTHELLEPAWMGTDDPAERALHQGLIKLAAGFVHAVRGNPRGLAKNLEGARRHLADAGPAAGTYGVDLPRLVAAIEALLVIDAGRAPGNEPGRHARPPVIRRTTPA